MLWIGGTFYVLYLLFCATLLVLLPTTNTSLQPLVLFGIFGCLLGGMILVLTGFIAFSRIARSDVPVVRRRRGLIRAIIVLLPGLIISGVVPWAIMREPPLTIQILSPTKAEDFVAPLAVTMSAEHATSVLHDLGRKVLKYRWDFEGDNQINEETALPVTTALYNRPNTYTLVVQLLLDDGTTRVLARRIPIPKAVFSIAPAQPIVEKPVRFSVSHLLEDPKQMIDVQWDYDGDGVVDATLKTTEAVHTYYGVGRVTVTATVNLQNNVQGRYQRTLDISPPPALPFEITLVTDPKELIGPEPFGATFRLDTTEPLKEVTWTFGDGTEERGASLLRVGHSFVKPGIYSVTARVRSKTGSLAELATVVRVTETLDLPDLRFDAASSVKGGIVMGEVPLTVNITPVTAQPLIEFSWEAHGATFMSATGATLNAIYREDGTYTAVLLAQDPEGRAVRIPITVEVLPPSAQPVIQLKPEGGAAPLRVEFDASETFVPSGEQVAGFAWTFGDEPRDTTPETGAAKVEHTYRTAGEFIVTVRVILVSGKEYAANRTIIVRKPALSACLTASRLSTNVGKGVEFSATCSSGSPVSYLWDVRSDLQPDRTVAQSAQERYIHIFDEAGTYTVTLSVRDQYGGLATDSVIISVFP